MAKKRTRKRAGARRSRRKNPGMIANPRKRRRRKYSARATYRRNPVQRRRRRSYRRNPAVSLNSIPRMLLQGVKDSAVMVGGEMVSNVVANFIPPIMKDAAGNESQVSVWARKLAGASAAGFVFAMFGRGRDFGRFAVAGALASPIKATVKPLLSSVPILGNALNAYPAPRMLAAYPTPRALPARSGMGAYARPRALGCDSDGSGFYGYGY